MMNQTTIFFLIIIVLAIMICYQNYRIYTFKNRTFEITKSLFGTLEADRPEIAVSAMHVFLLTKCFIDYLPLSIRIRINEEELKYGALLHDIGKIGIPKEILNKPGKLEKEEMELMRHHTDIGAKMLGRIHGLKNVSSWVLYHHERMDGTGYYKLKGNEIPLEARIVAITDTYSSIIMASAFKPSRTHEDAISILKMEVGTQFDPELTEAFFQIPPNRLNQISSEVYETIEMYMDHGQND